jgi:hypothetical protein
MQFMQLAKSDAGSCKSCSLLEMVQIAQSHAGSMIETHAAC